MSRTFVGACLVLSFMTLAFSAYVIDWATYDMTYNGYLARHYREDAAIYQRKWRRHLEDIRVACYRFTHLDIFANGAIQFDRAAVAQSPDLARACYDLHDVPQSMR